MAEPTLRQLEMMRHAVGKRWHRNHYVTSKGTEDDDLWGLLVRDGYAVVFRDGIVMCTYHLTTRGLQVLEPPPKAEEQSQ